MGTVAMRYDRALRICRAAAGLQQTELAQKAGVGASYLSLIEAGKRTPSLETVRGICEALGIPPALFMLLASDVSELKGRHREDVNALSSALLNLLVSAEAPRRRRRG